MGENAPFSHLITQANSCVFYAISIDISQREEPGGAAPHELLLRDPAAPLPFSALQESRAFRSPLDCTHKVLQGAHLPWTPKPEQGAERNQVLHQPAAPLMTNVTIVTVFPQKTSRYLLGRCLLSSPSLHTQHYQVYQQLYEHLHTQQTILLACSCASSL